MHNGRNWTLCITHYPLPTVFGLEKMSQRPGLHPFGLRLGFARRGFANGLAALLKRNFGWNLVSVHHPEEVLFVHT